MGRRRSLRSIAIAGLVLAPSVAVGGQTAQAANQDGQKNSGELIYYYNSNKAGAYSDFGVNVANLAGYNFRWVGTTAAGLNTPVKNNAASVENKAILMKSRVYYNSNFIGDFNETAPGSWRNLSPALKNQNASHNWVW